MEGPFHVLVYLGLELVVRIPKNKMQEVVDKIQLILSQKKTTIEAMQSFIGSQHLCCRATDLLFFLSYVYDSGVISKESLIPIELYI